MEGRQEAAEPARSAEQDEERHRGEQGQWGSGVTVDQTHRLSMVRSYVIVYFRAFPHGVMGRRIDPSWGGPIELFLVPASAPRLV